MGTLSREETPAFSFLLSALGSKLKGKTFALQGVSELGSNIPIWRQDLGLKSHP